MTYITSIHFIIQVNIFDKNNKYIKLDDKIVKRIREDLINGKFAITYFDQYFFSKQFGNIKLAKCNIIQFNKDTNHLDINLLVYNDKKLLYEIEDAEEIIWTIFHIKYDQYFVKHKFISKGFFHKNKYNIELLDIPHVISILDYSYLINIH